MSALPYSSLAETEILHPRRAVLTSERLILVSTIRSIEYEALSGVLRVHSRVRPGDPRLDHDGEGRGAAGGCRH